MFANLKSRIISSIWKRPPPSRQSQFINVGFHGDKNLLNLTMYIANKCEIFIETGSNVGSTLAYVARCHPAMRCLSCEPDRSAFEQAKKNTSSYINVELFEGTSQQFIQHLSAQEQEIFLQSCFFWLDAHGYGFEWPLKKELEFITSRFSKGYVLIDDFKVPGREYFIYDEYEGQVCSYDYVKEALDSRKTYQLYYPTYKDKTSKHHPLCGWGLLVFGDTDFQIPAELVGKIERAL